MDIIYACLIKVTSGSTPPPPPRWASDDVMTHLLPMRHFTFLIQNIYIFLIVFYKGKILNNVKLAKNK